MHDTKGKGRLINAWEKYLEVTFQGLGDEEFSLNKGLVEKQILQC